MSGRSSVRLHIASIVVDGLVGLSREALAEAVRAEIATRLAADYSLASRTVGTAVDRIDGGSFDVSAVRDAAGVGRGIGAAVFNSLSTQAGGTR